MTASKKLSSFSAVEKATTRFCGKFPDVQQAKVGYVASIDNMFRKLVKGGKLDEALNRFMDLQSEVGDEADSDSEEDDGADEKGELAEKDKQVERDLNRTQAAWNGTFLGGGNDVLRAYIGEWQNNFSRRKHYAKVIPIVQSSGAGKSRLVHQYGKERVGIIYTIRRDDQGGYPPGDPEITEYLSASLIHNTSHEALIALLGATLRVGKLGVLTHAFVRTQDACAALTCLAVQTEFNNSDNRPLFAKVFSERMAPDISKKALTGKAIPLSTKISNVRSDYRIAFVRQVMREADKIFAKLKGQGMQEVAADDSV